MVLKATSIHANFFPQGERYTTSDTAAAADDASDRVAAGSTAVNTPLPGPTPSGSRRHSLSKAGMATTGDRKGRSSLLQRIGLGKTSVAKSPTVELSEHDKDHIILVDWDAGEPCVCLT